MVTDRVEVGVAGRPLGDAPVGAGERGAQVRDRIVAVAGQGVVAGELVVEAGVAGVVGEALLEDRDAALVVAGEVVRLGGIPMLVGGDREGRAGLTADHQHRRLVFQCGGLTHLADVGADE